MEGRSCKRKRGNDINRNNDKRIEEMTVLWKKAENNNKRDRRDYK